MLAIVAGPFLPSIRAEMAGRAAVHVTLTNGFDLICDHQELRGDKVRFYTRANGPDFVEVAADRVASVETILVPIELSPVATPLDPPNIPAKAGSHQSELTKAELQELLSDAGARHNVDVHLLASLVHAESGGHTRAVSKAGARGLMQLMPRTAVELGVSDSFTPEDNVSSGVAYLDSLLTRYHDNLALALAAYNAGPAAVDRWHGVPPYRETQRYVARIIRDFNTSVRGSRTAEQAVHAGAEATPPSFNRTATR